MLDLKDVHSFYGESHVLHGLTMNVKDGSVVALVGRNGMGKTTTIRTIMGLTPPRSGSIKFNGKEIAGLQPNRIGRMGICVVPQGRHIFRSLSVKENLTTSARTNGKPTPWTLEKVYTNFPVLKERASVRGNMLSGGEQQMLSIGRALMTNPDLLLLDEPSEGLAPVIVKDTGRIINQIKQSGFSILIVEQSLPLVLSVADYI
jgi:branched-chain amino acid transport system ATP-binding protein